MKIFNRDFRFTLAKETQEIVTKRPNFVITNFTSNNPFTNLIIDESNYFEQYILYVAKCVDYLSNKVASAKLHLYDSNDQEIDENILYQDLKSLNPYMTVYEGRKLKEIHKFLTGVAYWYIDREPELNQQVEYYPLDPTKMQLKTDSRGLPSYFHYIDGDGKTIPLDYNDVIMFRDMNPQNWFEGMSIVKRILYATNAYNQGAQYNMNKLGNNMSAEKFIVFDGISDDERDKIEEQMRNKYTGVRNASRTGILNTPAEVISTSDSQKELDFVEGMKMLRQDILAFFGIPEALFFPSATNSNTKEAVRLFQSDTLEPLIQQETSVLNEQLLRKVGIGKSNNEVYYFKFDEVVEADKDAQVSQATQLFTSGIYTRNQALKYIGDEPLEDEVLGNEYSDSGLLDIPEEDNNEEPDNEIEEVKSMIKGIYAELEDMIQEKKDKEWRAKNIKLADDQENIMINTTDTLFQTQFKDSIDYINKTEKPTVRGIFNYKDNVEYTKKAYRESYMKIVNNTSDVGNVEIKEAVFKKGIKDYKNKAVSGSALKAIEKRLTYFSTEISDTTQKALRKLMANGIESGFDKSQFRGDIAKLFNEYLDGANNIQVLSKNGFYVENVGTATDGQVVVNSTNRYNTMLERISKSTIPDTEKMEAFKALRGVIDTTDIIGKQVDNLLSTLYKVPKFEGITYRRSVTIARTEATYARNLGFQDLYTNNPFVTKKKWKSLHDKDVRIEHMQADGQVVKKSEPFIVGGERLMFPGDTSMGASAENIINCRCRESGVID